MIGKLKIDNREAILNDHGEWECSDKVLEKCLNLLCSPDDSGSEYEPIWGRSSVMKAAEELGGTYEFPPAPKFDPEKVY
jgi:hypothetical protein